MVWVLMVLSPTGLSLFRGHLHAGPRKTSAGTLTVSSSAPLWRPHQHGNSGSFRGRHAGKTSGTSLYNLSFNHSDSLKIVLVSLWPRSLAQKKKGPHVCQLEGSEGAPGSHN